MNWDDPSARAALIERVGPKVYGEMLTEHRRASVVATVNGYSIRPVMSRFGRLFHIDSANVAFHTLPEAEAHARKLTPTGAA
jgi:hypothetical protein